MVVVEIAFEESLSFWSSCQPSDPLMFVTRPSESWRICSVAGQGPATECSMRIAFYTRNLTSPDESNQASLVL